MLEPTGNDTIDALNRKLADTYGLDIASDNPRYRIVWADHQLEYRKGTFEDHSDEGIFLREVTEVRQVQKYPLYPETWILEKLQNNVSNPELMSKRSFEPIWVYGAANSDPNPDWPHTAIIVNSDLYIKRKQMTKSDYEDAADKKFIAEKALFKTMIQDQSEYLVGALVSGAAVSVPKNYIKGADDGNK